MNNLEFIFITSMDPERIVLLAGKLITPSKDLFRGYNGELGEQVISTVTGEVAVPIIEQQTKIAY